MLNIFYVVVIVTLAAAQHPSPCPEVFKYTEGGPGRWAGELILDSEFPLSGVWIRVQVDRKVEKIESEFGETVPREEKSYLIKSREYNLIPGSPLRVPIVVTYNPDEPAPSLVSVRLNARNVCPAPPASAAAVPSKCPGVFTLDKDQLEGNRWHGSLTLSTEFELKGVWLRIVLDRPAELLGNEFGEVRTEDNINYLIANRNHTLVPGRPLKVGFWVKYAQDGPVPTVHTVRLNGRTVCGQIISEDNNHNIIYFASWDRFTSRAPALPPRHPDDEASTLPPRFNFQQQIFPPFNPSTPPLTKSSIFTTLPPLTSTSILPSTVPIELDTSKNQFVSCGTVVLDKIDLITFGETARSAQWPWHGAIYLVKPKSLDYICGMSLISEKHALTAAHCVVESISTKKVRDPQTLKLFFGLLNRTEFNASSVQNPTVNSIIVHKDYKVSENDIAVIKFNNKVKFTQFVRPVCLWEGDNDQRFIVNGTGTVVGFGVTQSGAISQELMYANILVVDTPTCIFSHRDFYSKYTSLNTFCAGNLTQSAVCNGDSGGAMVFRREGSDVWQIRGIVSTAVRNVDTGLCDYNYYAIFTDAAKFTSWIEMAIAR